jgi:transcriptional regulator with XRE-family HTH domain
VICDFSAYARRRSTTNVIDGLVGSAIRAERRRKGCVEHELAAMVKISPEQLRRYENGIDRISAATLFSFTRALGVPVAQFFRSFDT